MIFRKNKPFYPHTLMARVFAENGEVISRDDLESATQAFLDAQE
jgi:hypothetical protein